MELEDIIQSVRGRMPAKRWEHVQGVMDTAVILAERFGADRDKAHLAATIHDVAKYWPISQLEHTVIEQDIQGDLLAYDRQLLHAPVGAYVAEVEYGIVDPEILDAIRYHTSGRANMTLLDKVVCLADYMEPGRDYPGVNDIRKLANTNIDQALIAGFNSTISHLIAQGKSIYPLTILARNSLIEHNARTHYQEVN